MTNSPRLPRPVTWEVIQRSRNEAVIDLLSAALDCQATELRRTCLESLLAREEPCSLRSIIAKWKQLTPVEVEVVSCSHRNFAPEIRAILTQGSEAEKTLALAASCDLHLGGLLPELIDIVCQRNHSLVEPATHALLSICEYWGHQARIGRDVPSTRGPMLEGLYQKLLECGHQRQSSIVEAWCRLANWDDALQRGLVSDPLNDGYRPLLKRLGESSHPAVLHLLAGYIWRPATPKSILKLITERTDKELVFALSETLDNKSILQAARKLYDQPPLACFVDAVEEIRKAPLSQQKRLWLLYAASTDDTTQVVKVALELCKQGNTESRTTAAEMMRVCRKVELEKLVWAIQKSSLEGQNGLGDALEQLALWIKHPSTILQRAARDFFEEFTLARLLDQIRRWPSPLCKAMARIVRLTEDELPRKLVTEMHSPSPKRRIASIQATQLLDLSRAVSEELLPMVHDPRLEIRVRVIDLLSALGHEALNDLLPKLLDDASTDVQEAAARAIRRLARRRAKSDNPVISTVEK